MIRRKPRRRFGCSLQGAKDERKIESRNKIVSKVQTQSSLSKSKARLRNELKSKPGKNYFSK